MNRFKVHFILRGIWKVACRAGAACLVFSHSLSRERRRTSRTEQPETGSFESHSASTYSRMEKLQSLQGHRGKVNMAGWNCQGQLLASASVDKTARLWLLREGQSTAVASSVLSGHTSSVQSLVWEPTNPNNLATASHDKTVRLWDTRTKNSQRISTVGEIINIAWNPSGSLIATGSELDEISILDVRKTSKCIWSKKYPFQINELGWNRNGTHFFMAALQKSIGTVEIMSVEQDCSLKHIHTLSAHTGASYCLDFDYTGQYLAVGSADSLVSIWNLADLVCIACMDAGYADAVKSISFSHDSKIAVTDGNYLDIAAPTSENPEDRFRATVPPNIAISTVAYNPKVDIVAFAAEKGVVQLLS